MNTKNQNKLFQEFPAISTEAWETAIAADLKGADYEKKLVWKTLDNFKVRPYYREENLENIAYLEGKPNEFPFIRGFADNNDWLIRQDIVVDDCEKACQKAKNAVAHGAQSIGFIQLGDNDFCVKTLIEGIDLNVVEVNFTCRGQINVQQAIEDLFSVIQSNGFDPTKVSGSIDADPLKTLLLKGKCCHEESVCFDFLQSLIEKTKNLPHFQVIGVSGAFLKNCGASITQELGYSLSCGVEYLNQLTDRGLKADEIAKNIRFNFGITGSYFPEMAKFRAARWLWAHIVKSYGVDESDGKMTVHAATSFINNTLYDPYVNMLRTATEAMSATLGSIHSLTINPFNAAYEMSNEFSDRIARNQQIMLKEESHFDKVVDVAAGSYFIENLTNEIAEQTWKIFLDVEEQGGFLEAIKKGTIQANIENMAETRRNNMKTRRDILLGTNQFPNFTEHRTEAVCECALTPCDCTREGAYIHTLKPFRLANDFENLRLATDQQEKRPIAFMLTIGNLGMRKARAQFACNFFACAGYEVMDNNGFQTVEEGVQAAIDQKADIIVLCSSDEEYAVFAPEAFEKIQKRAIFVVAGNPECVEELKAKGIEYFIHVRSNLLEMLKTFNHTLSIN
ncbi:MAG: methylmalonyl-CoA mutase family protein [Bacteroidales bacterium]|nr:methylmalonyl-CoA mutase family protein [Bacteroidales bacterium]